MFGKFTLDAIATSGFGIECNSFKEPDNIFRLNAIELVRVTPKYVLQFFLPKVAQRLGLTLLDRNHTKFFVNIIRKTMESRRVTGRRRNDIIDIFLDELDKDHKEDSFTKEDLELGFVSTALLFFFAGKDLEMKL